MAKKPVTVPVSPDITHTVKKNKRKSTDNEQSFGFKVSSIEIMIDQMYLELVWGVCYYVHCHWSMLNCPIHSYTVVGCATRQSDVRGERDVSSSCHTVEGCITSLVEGSAISAFTRWSHIMFAGWIGNVL